MRCGLCGSKKISLINSSSYSMKKGIVGAAVLGPVGAVAGINGKSSMKYHCMACGQDSLDIMESYREQEIDEAVANGDSATLDRLRNTWRNIEYPLHGKKSNTHAKVISTDNVETSKKISEDDIESASTEELALIIKDDISATSIPYKYDDLLLKYDSNDNVEYAFVKLFEDGYAHVIRRNGKRYIQPATSIDEIEQFAQMTMAGLDYREDIEDPDEVIDIIKKIITDNPGINEEKLQKLLEDEHPEYAMDGNPYGFLSIVENSIDELIDGKEIVYEKNGYRTPAGLEQEKILMEKVKEKAERLSSVRLTKTQIENIKLKNTILEILDRSYKSMSADEVHNASTELSTISRQKCSALLKTLVDDGKATKTMDSRCIYFEIKSGYKKYDIPQADSSPEVLHDDEYGREVLDALEKNEGEKLTFDQILKVMDDNRDLDECEASTDPVYLYAELLHYQKEGYFENVKEGTQSYWIFTDKSKMQKRQLESKRADLEKIIDGLKQEIEDKKSECEKIINEVDPNMGIDTSELRAAIDNNISKTVELQNKLPQLKGFFKKRERNQVENEINYLNDLSDKLKADLKSKEREAHERYIKRIEQIKEPIKALEIRLNDASNQIKSINNEINSLNNGNANKTQNNAPQKIEVKDDIEKVYDYVKAHPECTVGEIMALCEGLEDRTAQKVSWRVKQLETRGRLSHVVRDKKWILTAN